MRERGDRWRERGRGRDGERGKRERERERVEKDWVRENYVLYN